MPFRLVIFIATLLFSPALAHAESKTFVIEKLVAQWGGPETRTRCSKWASTTGFKCNGLKCGRTTWKTCVGHATDLLQHKIMAQVFVHDFTGDISALRQTTNVCLSETLSGKTTASKVVRVLKSCFEDNQYWGLRYSVSTHEKTEW